MRALVLAALFAAGCYDVGSLSKNFDRGGGGGGGGGGGATNDGGVPDDLGGADGGGGGAGGVGGGCHTLVAPTKIDTYASFTDSVAVASIGGDQFDVAYVGNGAIMMEIIDPTAAASSPASVLACSNCASPRLARVGSGGLLQAAAVGDNGTANQQAYAIAVARNLTNPSTTQQSCASTPALADVAQSGTVAVAARQCPNDLSAPAMLFSGTLTKTFANGALETRVAANPGAGAPYVAFLSASGISTGLVDKSTLGTNASSFVASPGTFGLGFDVTPDDAHVWVGYSDMSSNLVIAYGLAGATATKVITPSLATTNVSANQPVSVAATNSDAMIAFSSGTSVHVVRATPTSTTVTTVLTVDGRGPQLAYQPPSAAYPNGVFVLGWVSGSPNPLPTGIGGPTPNVINSAPWWVSFTCP